MNPINLNDAVRDVPSLEAVFVTTMPDCLLFDSWIRHDATWQPEQVASYFGDLFRANREGLKALDSWSSDMQVTIESPEHLILVRELSQDFVCSYVFERSAALGMVRLYVTRMYERIKASLPTFEVEERPRGVRIVEFLQRYAPDPHAILLRTSLRTGLPLSSLESPESLEQEQVEQLEATACSILGLDSLAI